jgi:hypothetical protein
MRKPLGDLYVRVGWYEVVLQGGGTQDDIDRILRAACKAAFHGRPIPEDKYGAHHFFSLDWPGEDH